MVVGEHNTYRGRDCECYVDDGVVVELEPVGFGFVSEGCGHLDADGCDAEEDGEDAEGDLGYVPTPRDDGTATLEVVVAFLAHCDLLVVQGNKIKSRSIRPS